MAEYRSEHIADERECIERDVFGKGNGLRRPGPISPEERIHDLANELTVKALVVDRLIKNIERLTSEAIQPVAALSPDRVLMSDGSVFEQRVIFRDDLGGDRQYLTAWIELDPLPRTRRAIAKEIAKEGA